METNISIIRDFIVGAYATGRNVVSMDRALCALKELEANEKDLRQEWVQNEKKGDGTVETNIDIINEMRDARIAELVTEVAILAGGKRTYKRENGELKAEVARLHKACTENEFAVKTLLLKAMGITDDPGYTAEELAEMLTFQINYRVQRRVKCPKCNGAKMYTYKDYVYDGECICTAPCDECGRTGFVWKTVEAKR